MELKEIGAKIRDRRKELGMSQQELADAVGYADRGLISRVEAGTVNLTMDKMIKIAEKLRVPIYYFFDTYDNKPVGTSYDKSYGRNVRTIRFEFVSVCQPHLQNACFRAFWGSVVNGIDIKLPIILPQSCPISVRLIGQFNNSSRHKKRPDHSSERSGQFIPVGR